MLKRLLAHNAGYLGIISNRLDRPWGTLFYNPENPDHFDSNHAEGIDVPPGKIAATVDEIQDFYRSHGLVSRIYCNQFTNPADLSQTLQRQGYSLSKDRYEVMLWDSIPADLPLRPGITIERVEIHNRAEAQAIVGSERKWRNSQMVAQVFTREFDHPDVNYYLVRRNGMPAATGFLFYQGSLARVENIITLPEHRRQGCALALVQHMQQVFTRRGGEGLYLLVANPIARDLYKLCGFKDMGEVDKTMAWLE